MLVSEKLRLHLLAFGHRQQRLASPSDSWALVTKFVYWQYWAC